MGDPKGFLVVPIGYNPSDELRSLELDASDRLKVLVDAVTGSITVTIDGQPILVTPTQTTPANMAVSNHGWFSNAWQKSPIPFGISGSVGEIVANNNLQAGDNTLSGTAVPNGEIWVITNISMAYVGTMTNVFVRGGILRSSAMHVIYDIRSMVSTQFYDRQVNTVLFPGDKVSMDVYNATAGNDAYLEYLGYRIDTDQ